MTAGRRLAALAAVAVVAATCATAPAGRDALAAPAAPAVVANQPNTTSYNLCIKVSCGGSGIQKADEYAGLVFNRPSPNPLSSGFQEVCQGSSCASRRALDRLLGPSDPHRLLHLAGVARGGTDNSGLLQVEVPRV